MQYPTKSYFASRVTIGGGGGVGHLQSWNLPEHHMITKVLLVVFTYLFSLIVPARCYYMFTHAHSCKTSGTKTLETCTKAICTHGTHQPAASQPDWSQERQL